MHLHRSPQVHADYEWHRAQRAKRGDGCFFCAPDGILEESNHFYIIHNRFPLDGWAKHDMLVLKRHADTMTLDELSEWQMWVIKNGGRYDHQLLNSPERQSIPGHLHFHLLKRVPVLDMEG